MAATHRTMMKCTCLCLFSARWLGCRQQAKLRYKPSIFVDGCKFQSAIFEVTFIHPYNDRYESDISFRKTTNALLRAIKIFFVPKKSKTITLYRIFIMQMFNAIANENKIKSQKKKSSNFREIASPNLAVVFYCLNDFWF